MPEFCQSPLQCCISLHIPNNYQRNDYLLLLEKIAHTENSFPPHTLSYEQHPLIFFF